MSDAAITREIEVEGVQVLVCQDPGGWWFGRQANGLRWDYSQGVQPGCATALEAAEQLWAHVCDLGEQER